MKNIRPEWYSCACCPPNFARMIGSVQRYIYTLDDENKTVYINLFADSILDNNNICIVQKTQFPYESKCVYTIDSEEKYTIKIRIPYWAHNINFKVNGISIDTNYENGYLTLEKMCNKNTLEIVFDTPIMAVKANSAVIADSNRIAVQRGPFVFCAEQTDNEMPVTSYRISADEIKNADVEIKNCRLGKIPFITISTKSEIINSNSLYVYNPEIEYKNAKLKLIPYYSWANRGAKDMMVWFHQK